MPEESQNPTEQSRRQSATHVIHGIIQFLRIVRHRKTVVIACLAVTSLFGALYFATATRYYQSVASLMVMQTGADVRKADLTSQDSRPGGLMPTYQRLISSDAVLEMAANSLAPGDRIDLQGVPRHKWADALRENLNATIGRRTSVLEVSYRSKKPSAAAAVVRAVVKSYLDFMRDTHQSTAGKIEVIFQNEKKSIQQRLDETVDLLSKAKHKYRHMDLGPDSERPEVTRAIRLNKARVEMEEQRITLLSTLNSLETAIRNDEDLQQHILSLEGTVGRTYLLAYLGIGDVGASSRVALEREMLEDRAERRTMIEFYGRRHPLVMEIDDRIRLTEGYLANYHNRVKRQLAELRENELGPLLVNMVRQKLAEAWNRERAFDESYQKAEQAVLSIDAARQELTELQRKVSDLRHEKDTIVSRIADIKLSEQHGTIRATLIDEPKTPTRPVSPKLSLVVLLCLVSGTGIGAGIIYIMDVVDDRFRSPEELRTHLDTPILAMVRQLHPPASEGIDAIQIHALPDAVESEAFRTLRTTLAFSGKQASRIVVSSAEPGDGKTTVLVNLGVANAHAGKKTLLIDADLRRPGLTTLLDMKRRQGLSDILRSEDDVDADVQRLIVSTPIERLDVLPAGLRRSNPAELLASPAMEELLAWAEARYDQILVDCPPALAASDCSIVGQLVDGAMLVVQPTKNRRHVVMRAVEVLTSVDIELLGVVINRVDEGASAGYYGYGTGYGYGYGEGDEDSEETSPQQDELIVPRKVA